MQLTEVEKTLGTHLKNKNFVLMGFEQGYKTTLILRTITQRLTEGQNVLYISPVNSETAIQKLCNLKNLYAIQHGNLLISNQLKLDKLWEAVERLNVQTVVFDSLYEYTGKFTSKQVDDIIKTANERNVNIIITQPLSENNKIELPTLLKENTIKYLVRDRFLRSMDKVLIAYETGNGVRLQTVSDSKKPNKEDFQMNFTKEEILA